MATYVESYTFTDTRYGIEDFQAPGKHWSLHYKNRRFKCWVGGCGICDGHDTLEEARQHIREYAIDKCKSEVEHLQGRINLCQNVVDKLESDPMQDFKERI